MSPTPAAASSGAVSTGFAGWLSNSISSWLADPTKIWIIIGLIFFACGVYVYRKIAGENKDRLALLSRREKLAALFSYVPTDPSIRPTPVKHIVAGVLAFIGLSLFVGGLLSHLVVHPNYNEHSAALSLAGMIFALLLSGLSFWTLWQTKKIESLQGAHISGFKKLTSDLADAIKDVHDDFVRHGCSASSHHRVIFVTNNPYFGVLSFFNDPVEIKFREALTNVAHDVSRSMGSTKFTLMVLCGNEPTIEKFNKEFFENKSPQENQQDREAEIRKANQSTEEFLSKLTGEAEGNATVVFRGADIPDIQFAIIGNTVFEFILLEPRPGSITGIAGARKIDDALVCNRFLEHFKIFKKLNGLS
jgi:hypothetical protein